MNSFSAGKIISAIFGTVLRFIIALCLLASFTYLFKNMKFLPCANIPNAAIMSVLGVPGFLLLVSLKLLV